MIAAALRCAVVCWTLPWLLAAPLPAADDAAPAAKPSLPETKPAAPAATDASPPAAKAEPKLLPWLASLEEGHRRGLADGRPLLVRVGAAWCPTCRKLEQEIAQPAVQAELSRWTLVYVDATLPADDATKLGVTAVPALRLRTPDGRPVVGHDGLFSADDLVDWLKKNYDAAAAVPADVLLAAGKPDAIALVRLVRQLEDRSAVVREAAIRRLLPYPDVARSLIVKTMHDGKLAARLSAIELLRAWQAPVEDLDPWVSATISDARLAALDKWNEQQAAVPPRPEKLSPEQLAAAGADIERMLKASDEEAVAIRERLARLGPALLPAVYARLKDAATDRQRERLLTLRYRLVADDALVLRWPGGLSRLAATDSRRRQQAAEELARRVTEADQRLLLELFSDTDPLVREICLRGLQNLGGKAATAALVDLLADPNPNVRAAVLKQLEESPLPSMVPKVAEYLARETDPDLLVHGIRFLRTIGGKAAIKTLMKLVKHESWQVRAEAAAGLASVREDEVRPRFPSSSSSEQDAESLQADVCATLIELLDDPDAFVVSRAVEGLSGVDLAIAVDPLVKAADKHPDLTKAIIHTLVNGRTMLPKAIPHVRKFCTHKDPAIRAAAILGLVEAAPDAMDAEVAAGLQDPDRQVRVAAAVALYELLDITRRQGAQSLREGQRDSFSVSTSPFSFSPGTGLSDLAARLLGSALKPKKPAATEATPATTEPAAEKPAEKLADEQSPWDRWLTDFYAGKHQPRWMPALVPKLEKMLASPAADERVAAARALVPLGKSEAALPVLLAAAKAGPESFEPAARILPWLRWPDRLRIFAQLQAMTDQQRDIRRLVAAMTEMPDRRAAEPFWKLLADPRVTAEAAATLEEGLRVVYLGERYYSLREIAAPLRAEVAAAAQQYAAAGPAWQRLAALALLANVAPDAAATTAAALDADAKLGDEFRRMAFQIMLISQADAKRRNQAAIAAIGGSDLVRRGIALGVLVRGPNHFATVGKTFYIRIAYSDDDENYRSGEPIVPAPPAGLKAAQIRPLLKDADRQTAAYAGYLLALFDDPAGMDALLRWWRDEEKAGRDTARLVYRAIAVLDDPQYVPVLRKIAAGLDEYAIREFYWTIRIMSGPEILRLRKELRDKYGTKLQ